MGGFLYNRLSHQRLSRLLNLFRADIFQEAKCFFGGGTAIALSLGEYRELTDISFLCADRAGYCLLRNKVYGGSFNGLLKEEVPHVKPVTSDRYGIRSLLVVDGVSVKVEIVNEGRLSLSQNTDALFPVPSLSCIDLFAEKLLSNTDRGAAAVFYHPDMIDLSMMVHHWGEIPSESIDKATEAYGDSVRLAFKKSRDHLLRSKVVTGYLKALSMDGNHEDMVRDSLLRAWPACGE